MARTTGSKNVAAPSVIKNLGGDSEDLALAEFTSGLLRWKALSAKMKLEGKTGKYEREVAETYRLLISKFTTAADAEEIDE